MTPWFSIARAAMTGLLAGAAPLLAQSDQARKPAPAPAPKTGNLIIAAALVDQNMQVRAVPLHAFVLVGTAADTFTTRTDVNGKATVSLPAGKYSLASVAPIPFLGQRYAWNLPVVVSAGGTLEVALTNDNASVSEGVAAGSPLSAERVDAAVALFDRLSHSVFRIEAGLAHGSGFLADTLGGVIITNSHVVESGESDQLAAVLDSTTRVRAQLLARDPDADIAILRLHPDHLIGRVRIPMQAPVGRPAVVAGERLVAMGFPLHQGLTITAGIASSVRAGAIISDVSINHGNSGGPLLNLGGEVVAVNTFGDFTDQGGPGVSGSVLIARAGPALARAAAELERTGPPPAAHLPTLPSDRIEIATLKAFADTADPKRYRAFSNIHIGGFDVTLQTPAQTFVAMKAFENEIAKDRKKREAIAGLPEAERYSEVRDYRDWVDYVGPQATPVVSLAIIPRVGETGGSVFARIMLGPNLKATYKFKGDVRGAQLFANQQAIEPIKGGHAPVKMYVDNQWVSLKDVADQGFYIYDIETLRPDSLGAPPSVVVAIRDLKNPDKLKCRELAPAVVAQAWNDFEAFFGEKRPAAGFRRADPNATKNRKAASQTDFLKRDCSWQI